MGASTIGLLAKRLVNESFSRIGDRGKVAREKLRDAGRQ
jgi:hypothetical protein